MFVFIFLGACISMKLVTSNPLTQSIQTCPGANYQQIQPYETFLIQPGSYHPYPQLLIQDQYNQPSLSDQISQIFWEKLLSHPTVRSILDTHNIYDQNLNTQTKPPNPYNPHNTEVVNNYIVVSSDYITINETEQPKANSLRNDLYTPNKANLVKEFKGSQDRVTVNKRKKKVLDPNHGMDAVINHDKPRKVKKNLDVNTFSIENIKCYTPAEVLDEGVKSPVKENCRNKEQKKKGQKRKEKQPNKAKSEKDSKTVSKKSTKRNKAKKKTKETCKETNGNISTKTANGRKYKKEQERVNNCDCKKMADITENKCKVKETIRSCNEETDDLFNLNQYCSSLENRCTRNSKQDSAKDSRNKYSDLPDDISVNYASYINDLFSNTKAPNSNLFYGSNMYPFDFSQMYQIPQYSNIDISKQQGNKSKKRKKKQKKKNSTRKKKEEDNNNSVEKVTKKSNKNNVDNVHINNNNNNIENDSLKTNDKSDFFSKIDNGINVENVIKKPEITNELENVEVTTKTMNIAETANTIPTIPSTITSEITTEKSTTTSKSSIEQITSNIRDDSESFEDPIQEVEIIQTLRTDDLKQKLISAESPNEIMIKIYEKRIPELDNMKNKDAIELLQDRERIREESYELQSSLNPYGFKRVSSLGFLDGIPSIFHDEIIDDYYPDFTADNHAYLVSEEMDLRNVHDRYFYTTHKNIDAKSLNTPHLTRFSKNIEHNHNDKTIEIDEKRSKLRDKHYDKVEHTEKSKLKDEEITFMTPPGLDRPGFITRKINIDKGDSKEIFYQHHNDYNNFDNVADKSDHSYKTERYDNKEKDKKQGSVVETVYARSKVVKYGQGQNFETPWKENKTLEEDGVKKDGKTIVIAKSISPEDFWQYQ